MQDRRRKAGLCGVRRNDAGVLRAVGYGRVSSAGLDPIEKKPLYHFLPGSDIFSVGGWGCNLSCSFCQNWSISQEAPPAGRPCTPSAIAEQGAEAGSVGVAYTYNEPLIGFEFVRDCAQACRGNGLRNVLVTNGFVNPEPAAELLPWIDALNIDVKSMDDAFYRSLCGGSLAPVLAFARQARAAGCHVEITNLLIPGHNDDDAGIARLAEWVVDALGATVPLHLSAYFPRYKLNAQATAAETLIAARAIATRSLSYVYLGNVATREGRDTCCPACGHVLVARSGYCTRITGIEDSRCTRCGRPADMVLDAGQ